MKKTLIMAAAAALAVPFSALVVAGPARAVPPPCIAIPAPPGVPVCGGMPAQSPASVPAPSATSMPPIQATSGQACPNTGGVMSQACSDCLTTAGKDINAQAACSGLAPVNLNPQTQWADCNALQLPTDKAICVDNHLMGTGGPPAATAPAPAAAPDLPQPKNGCITQGPGLLPVECPLQAPDTPLATPSPLPVAGHPDWAGGYEGSPCPHGYGPGQIGNGPELCFPIGAIGVRG